MLLESKEELQGFLSSGGATICDLAATCNVDPETIVERLDSLGIQLPSMTLDGPFDFIKDLRKGIRNSCPAVELIKDYHGGQHLLPKGSKGHLMSTVEDVYEAVHGLNYRDPYTGELLTAENLTRIDDNPDNFLVTNWEALGRTSLTERFGHNLGLSNETFEASTRYFGIKLEIERPYDQLIGGTYHPEYVHNLFCTWVSYPLNLYFRRNPEDESVFRYRSPTAIAWWAWSQLTHYGLLKGLKSISVKSEDIYTNDKFAIKGKSTSPNTMRHSASLNATQVLAALRATMRVHNSKIVMPSQTNVLAIDPIVGC